MRVFSNESALCIRHHKFIISLNKTKNRIKRWEGVPAGQSEDMNFEQSPELVSSLALPETALQAEGTMRAKAGRRESLGSLEASHPSQDLLDQLREAGPLYLKPRLPWVLPALSISWCPFIHRCV